MAQNRAALVAICHGGGPMPALGDPSHEALIHCLKNKVPELLKVGTPEAPRAIALITAHWEAEVPTISNQLKHELYYDYYNFPDESYELKYDASGDVEVAQKIFDKFEAVGLKPKMNPTRGWDHGVFIPMMLIAPDGAIPIVQVSVLASQSAPELCKMGQALAALREDNIAIVGSGSASYHNLRDWLMGKAYDPKFRARHHEWTEAVEEALNEEDETARLAKLEEWRNFPHSYEMHPNRGAEHFSPLLVCAGAAGDAKVHSSAVELFGAEQKMYWWS